MTPKLPPPSLSRTAKSLEFLRHRPGHHMCAATLKLQRRGPRVHEQALWRRGAPALEPCAANRHAPLVRHELGDVGQDVEVNEPHERVRFREQQVVERLRKQPSWFVHVSRRDHDWALQLSA